MDPQQAEILEGVGRQVRLSTFFSVKYISMKPSSASQTYLTISSGQRRHHLGLDCTFSGCFLESSCQLSLFPEQYMRILHRNQCLATHCPDHQQISTHGWSKSGFYLKIKIFQFCCVGCHSCVFCLLRTGLSLFGCDSLLFDLVSIWHRLRATLLRIALLHRG